MNTFKLLLLSFAAIVFANTSAMGQIMICPGDCHGGGLYFDGPPEDFGAPAGSEWADGSSAPTLPEVKPELWEDDPVSDDPMGDGVWGPNNDPGGASPSGVVCNADGDLGGPNGDIQNGGTEGDCIEVYMKIPIWVPQYESGVLIGWELDWHTTNAKEVCPEDPANCP